MVYIVGCKGGGLMLLLLFCIVMPFTPAYYGMLCCTSTFHDLCYRSYVKGVELIAISQTPCRYYEIFERPLKAQQSCA